MNIELSVHINDKRQPYLEASARLRGIPVTKLLRRIINTVIDDQMILSVLDDQEDVVKEKKKPDTHVTRARAQRPNSQTFSFRRSEPKTKADLQRELAEAVRNTAELPVE